MKLLVDVGNTRVKWAWLDGSGLQLPGSRLRADSKGAELIADLAGAAREPAGIFMASVADADVTAALARLLAERWPVPLMQARTEASASGVRNGYTEPAQMGVDRWLAMIGAFSRYRAAVCVVDAGTALTIDLVAADGVHAGGLILPGGQLMRSALLRETGAIGISVGRSPVARESTGLLGRDTESCIRMAAVQASACLVENCVKTWPRAHGGAPILVVTGGDAPALIGALSLPAEHRPELVLEGLAVRYGGAVMRP